MSLALDGAVRRLDALGLADGSLKERFLGRDRSPASIRQYAKFRRKMVPGELPDGGIGQSVAAPSDVNA